MAYSGPAFSTTMLEDGVVELRFDLAGDSVNKLNQVAIKDFDAATQAIAKDPSVIRRISSWHWQPGMLPAPDAPVWRMDAFRDRFLAAYGS